MKVLVGIGVLVCTAMAHAQTPAPVPGDCSATKPCAVTIGKDGRQTVRPASPAGTPVHNAAAVDDTDSGFYRKAAGPDAMSLEEAAVSYFDFVASVDARSPGAGKAFDPESYMWNRTGLTDAEAAEVLNVARRTATPEAKQAANEKAKTDQRQMCRELGKAGNADAQVAALQKAEGRAAAQEKAAGKALLDQLSAGTRASVLKVLAEHRKSITVGHPDWEKVRATQPEALEMHRAQICADVN